MSGGHWNFQGFKIQEAAANVNWAMTVLAEVEQQLDWGISGDTCYECAKVRVIAGLEAYFENVGLHEYGREPLAVLRGEAERHLCENCGERAYRYRCGKCGGVKDVVREPEKAALPVPCWNRACWDTYHGEPAPMQLVGCVGEMGRQVHPVE